MAAWFSPAPLLHTLIPVRGAESYKILNYGFFNGLGRRFWLPAGVTPRHYLFSHAGHYLLGSAILVAAAAASTCAWPGPPPARTRSTPRSSPAAASCTWPS